MVKGWEEAEYDDINDLFLGDDVYSLVDKILYKEEEIEKGKEWYVSK